MGTDWWGPGIMEGDIPRDMETFLSDMIGGSFDGETGNTYTRAMVERNMARMIRHIRADVHFEVGMQVLGCMVLKSQAYLSKEVCKEIVEAAKRDDPFWQDTKDPERQASVDNLISKLIAHQASTTMPCMAAVKEPAVQVGVAVLLLKCVDPDLEPVAVLMGKRRGSHGEGTWSIPGGHMEFGETEAQAAQRELEEETGLRLPLDRFRRATYTNDFFEEEGKHYITIYVTARCYPSDGEPELKEPDKCFEWRWVDKPLKPTFLCIQNLIKQGWWPF